MQIWGGWSQQDRFLFLSTFSDSNIRFLRNWKKVLKLSTAQGILVLLKNLHIASVILFENLYTDLVFLVMTFVQECFAVLSDLDYSFWCISSVSLHSNRACTLRMAFSHGLKSFSGRQSWRSCCFLLTAAELHCIQAKHLFL